MARSYRVARPSTGAGKADVLFAGGGGRRPPRIPQGTPRLRVDMNWEEAQEKTAHQARVRALAAAGYDSKVLENMSPEVTARLHAQMADDPIEAEQAKAAKEIEAKGADALSDLLGLGLNFDKIDQEAKAPEPPEIQLEAAPPTAESSVTPPSNILAHPYMANFMRGEEAEAAPPISVAEADKKDPFAFDVPTQDQIDAESAVEVAQIESDPLYSGGAADYASKERNLSNIYSIYDSLPDSLKEKFYPKFKDAMKEATPKEPDDWAHTASLTVDTKDGKFHVTWGKDGKEKRRIKLPDGPEEWTEIRVWDKKGRRGFYLRDKDDHQNYKKGKDGKPEFFSFPDDATDVRPRRIPPMTMRFNAFMENNKKYKDIVPHNPDGTPVLVDPMELYKKTQKGTIEREATVKFFEEDDLIIRMLQELNELKYGKEGNSEGAKAKRILQKRKNKQIELPSTK